MRFKSLVWIGKRLIDGHRVGSRSQSGIKARGASVALNDAQLIKQFEANPDNTYLVSFPRTGSHWLRMLMELYFERPLLTRSFYYPNEQRILALHTHDLDLTVSRRSVIYLYRDPVDTIYSQLRYHDEAMSDISAALRWAELYGQHLEKWLVREGISQRKTIVRYEALRTELVAQFEKICHHFEQAIDASRLKRVASIIDREAVMRKTPHDPRVVPLGWEYSVQRDVFRVEMGEKIREAILSQRPALSVWI